MYCITIYIYMSVCIYLPVSSSWSGCQTHSFNFCPLRHTPWQEGCHNTQQHCLHWGQYLGDRDSWARQQLCSAPWRRERGMPTVCLCTSAFWGEWDNQGSGTGNWSGPWPFLGIQHLPGYSRALAKSSNVEHVAPSNNLSDWQLPATIRESTLFTYFPNNPNIPNQWCGIGL